MTNKFTRSLQEIMDSQKETEKRIEEKFEKTEEIVNPKAINTASRISPQLSCTITDEDQEMLKEIMVHWMSKTGEPMNKSEMIRALIRMGHRRMDDIYWTG